MVKPHDPSDQQTSIPWPLLVLMLAPFGIPLAVGVYLLVLYPKPYLLAVPVVCTAFFAAIVVIEARFRTHASRLMAAACGLFVSYLYATAAWVMFGVAGAVGTFVFGLAVTALLTWKDALRPESTRDYFWGKPRDPKDSRTTSPF